MTQPYKTCPQCGQPAVLEMPQCRRCGFFYPPLAPVPGAGGSPMAPGYPPTYPGPPAVSERRSGPSRALAGCLTVTALLLCFVVAVALLRPHNRHSRRRMGGLIMTTQPAQPARGPDLTGQAGQSSGNGGGLFQETDSAQEMPTISVVNVESDHMTLVLTDVQGHDYKAISSGGVPQTLQVPPGDYRVVVYSDDPGIQANQGDAVFRKHKRYDAQFYHDSVAEPIHLGDSP